MSDQPWLPYLVTDYIKWLAPRTVFEWGSGASTLMFAKMGVNLVSIEHDKEWYDKIKSSLPLPYHAAYHLIPYELGEIGRDPANPAHYKSKSTELGEVNFRKYATYIDEYGRFVPGHSLFDLILIDGMARASCIVHAVKHVAPGGCIVIDNTGDRPYYLEQTGHLFGDWERGWERITFMGYGPILDYKWETTIFIKRTKETYE